MGVGTGHAFPHRRMGGAEPARGKEAEAGVDGELGDSALCVLHTCLRRSGTESQ